MMFPAKKIYSLVLAAPYIGQFGILSVRASTDFSDKAYKGFIYWNLANVIFMQELFESIGNTDGFIHAQSNMRLGDKNARIDEVAMRVFGKIDEIAQFRTEYDILEKARSPPQNVMAYNREYLQRLHELGAEELYRKLEPVLSK